MLSATILFICVGIVGGFISGLLGIGGGIIMVPLLTLAFTWLGVEPEYIYRLAAGTSLASIVFTSIASARAHNKHLPVRWDLVKGFAPYLVVGTFLGTAVATRINPGILKIVFVLFLFSLAVRMLFNIHLKVRDSALPAAVTGVVGSVIGLFCSFVGVGGGTMIVPYLTWNGIGMHSAVGVSSALGFFISLSGGIGYSINGLSETGLPWGALGYVHIPALVIIMITAVLFAPYGVKLAHKLTEKRLKLVFGLAMLIIGMGMAWTTVNSWL